MATTHHGITFTSVKNAVTDLGMDKSGGTAIDAKLRNALSSGTLVEFPPGKYKLTTEIVVDGRDNIGIRGTGDKPGDVKFVFPAGNMGAPDPANYVMLHSRGGSGFLFENVEIHQTTDHRTAASLVIYKTDKLEMHDVHWSGFNPRDSYAKGTCLYPSVTSENGVGHITNITIDGGGVVAVYPHRRGGIQMQYNHKGELIFDGLDIRELGSSAFRASNCTGVVTLKNSYFENNDNCSFRIGGGSHPSKKSKAVNCTVVADTSKLQHLPNGENYENIEGVRIDANNNGWKDARVEDCTFIYRSIQSGWARGIIAAPSFSGHSSFTIAGCTFRVDCDNAPPIVAYPPGTGAKPPTGVTVSDCHFTGSARKWGTDGVITISSRDASSVSGACIDLPNASPAGVAISNSTASSVTDSSINVAGSPTRLSSNVSTSGITTGVSGKCRVPGDTSTPTPDPTPDEPAEEPPADDGTTAPDPTPDPLPNTITLVGTGSPAQYSFEVAQLQPQMDTIERWDDVTETTAKGYVTEPENVDTFYFRGPITAFEFLSGSADVYINGRKVTPEDVVATKRLTIVGPNDGVTGYQILVTGLIRAHGATGGQTEALADRAAGSLADETHSFRYSGEIDGVSLDGPAHVLVDD